MILRAIAILVIATSTAAAAPRVPSSDLPGREWQRFVDPPAARLLQPSQPSTILPYEAQPSDVGCRRRASKAKQRWRVRCTRAR